MTTRAWLKAKERSISLWRLQRRYWPGTVLGLVCVAVLITETTHFWRQFASFLQGLDFDPGRVALIQAWLAGVLLAAGGALATGRPWLSAVTAGFFVGLTYVLPLGVHLTHDVPELFGVREQTRPSAIYYNLAVALAIAFLAAIPAAATGDLLRRGAARMAALVRDFWKTRRLLPGQPLSLLNAAILISSLLGSLSLAPGVDSLLRFGPEHGVYRPPPARNLEGPDHLTERVPSAGQVLSRTYHSEAMGEERRYLIYLPPSYGLKAALRRHYPVVYLLHGDPSSPGEWVALGAPQLFDAGTARGVLPESILVMPDGNGRVTAATQWANRRDGRDRIEDSLLELVSLVDHENRTLVDRRYRVIAGLSSGAFGAANIAARHPDLFGVAMSFSGYFVAPGPVFGDNTAYIRANSPYFLVQDQPQARSVYYVLVVGAGDSATYRSGTQAFADVLTSLRVGHNLHFLPGGHGGQVWAQGLALGMDRIARDLSRPAGLPAEGGDRHRH